MCINCDVHGNVLRSSYNLPVFYSYCNSFLIRDVCGEFGLIKVHLFNILPICVSIFPMFFRNSVAPVGSVHTFCTATCWTGYDIWLPGNL